MSDTSKDYPNPTPQHETVLADERPFVEACMAKIGDDVERYGWRLGKSITTYSKEWGLVWRVDLDHAPLLGRTMRMICWRQLDNHDVNDISLALIYVEASDKL